MAADAREELQGQLGDAFVIERELTGGAMSRVFVARETALGRRVAIKLLLPELADAVSAERFRREIQVLARLQHPHIVPVHSAGGQGALLFYTMPFIEGESLRSLLTRVGPMPVGSALAMLVELADALAFAHAHGVVHRDLKPENVLVSDGHALLADFGVAKALGEATGAGRLTTAGIVLGTPAYMAPEQVAGDPAIDHRADIYSLGLVAYEMLSGASPYSARSPQAMFAAHVTEVPQPLAIARPGIPAPVEALIMRCLEKDPSRRPQSAAELAAGARSLASGGPPAPIRLARGAGRRRSTLRWAGAAVVMIGASFIGYRLVRPTAARGGRIESLAVLPLVNVGGDPQEEYFADGVTDDLTSALAKVPGLRVAARTSAFSFKSRRDLGAREIGRQLDVAAVLEASIRRDGDRLRVTAQLINAADGLSLWSDTFERRRADVFQMQDELTQAIVAAVQPRLGGRPVSGAPVSHGTANLAAYDLYQKGRFFMNKRDRTGLTSAVHYFEQAVRTDSTYAAAWAGLADSWSLLGAFGFMAPREAFPNGRAAAQRALAIDSTQAEPWASLGLIDTFYAWQWDAAAREFDRAIALDPRYGSAYLFRGWMLAITGRLDEALESLRRGREVEPLSLSINVRVGTMLIYLGRLAEAERELRTTLLLDSTFVLARSELGNVLTVEGRADEALRVIPPVGTDFSRIGSGDLGYALAKSGRRAEARQLLDSIERLRPTQFVVGDAIAMMLVGLGDHDEAIRQLQGVLRDRGWGVLILGLDERFRPLWSDPRIKDIRRATNLADVPPAWERSGRAR